MISAIKSIQLFLFHHRKTTLVTCLLLCVMMVFLIFNLRLQENIMDLLPQKNKSIGRYAVSLRILNAADRLVFMVQMKSDDSGTDSIITAADALAEALQKNPLIQQVQYKWNVGELNEAIEVLRPFHADFFSQKDAQQLAASLTYASLDQMISGWKRMLQETPAPFLSQQLTADPLGMDRLFLQKFESLKGLDHAVSVENGILFSPDRRSLLFTATPNISSTDSSEGNKLVSDIQHMVDKVKQDTAHAIDIAWLGGHRFSVDNARFIKRDIALITSLSSVLISLLCLLVFKRIRYFIYGLLPAFFGALTATSCTFFSLSGISAIVLGMGAVLIGITVDCGLHVLYRADQFEKYQLTKDTIVNMISDISQPLLLFAGTTIGAFFVLIFSTFPGYRQLGWFSIIGVAASVVFVFFILPLLIDITGQSKRSKAILPLMDFFNCILNISKRYRSAWMILSVLIFLFTSFGLSRLHFDREIEKLNMVSPEVQKDWDALKAAFPGIINTSFIIITGKDEDTLFEQNEKIQAWLNNRQEDIVIQTASTPWLYPSKKTRLENRKRWQEFWSNDRKTNLIEDMKILAKNHRMHSSFFMDAIENLPGSIPQYDIAQMIKQPVIGQMLSNQIHLEGEQKMLSIPFSLKDSEKIDYFGKQLNDAFPNAFVSSGNAFIKEILHMTFLEFIKMGSLSLLVTLAILFLFTRNLLNTLKFFLPLSQAIVFTFGMMGWINLPLTIMSVLVIIFVFGLVVDYSLFIGYCALNDRLDFSHAGGSVMISALTTMIGLGALIFAKHPALHSIGITALLGVGSGFIFTLMNYGWVWKKRN